MLIPLYVLENIEALKYSTRNAYRHQNTIIFVQLFTSGSWNGRFYSCFPCQMTFSMSFAYILL